MYVFLGLLYTQVDEARLLKSSKVGLQGAANNYQWGLIRGLANNSAERIHVVNSVPMGTFPCYCKKILEKSSVVKTEKADVYNRGYINLPIIKQFQRSRSAYRSLKRIICQSDAPVTVIAYSLYGPYLKALYKLKKKYNHFQYVLVVPDLPGVYGIESRNPLIRFVQRKRGNRAIALSRSADGYVLLTSQMAKPLAIQNKPYVTVEGIYNGQCSDVFQYKRESAPVILYTGALDIALGLNTLVEAFQKLPAGTAKLHIAGAGPYVEELEKICSKNPDIVYLGYRSKEEIDRLQRSAAVLVNPRSGDEEYTKYSFPSKTIEYLSTGVPVVMNRLPGIPEEYNEHLFLTERSDVEGLAKTLKMVLEMDELLILEHGLRSIDFILNKKNGTSQAKKIVDLVKSLDNQ